MRLRALRRLVASPAGALGVVSLLLVLSAAVAVGSWAHRLPSPVAARHIALVPSSPSPDVSPSSIASASPSSAPATQQIPAAAIAHNTVGVGRLAIPAINVSAPIVAVGKDKNGVMQVPGAPFEVAWYSPGPFPGEAGDAVIGGHVTWYTNPVAIFYNLNKLKAGDLIVVTRNNGAVTRWKVQDNLSYPANVDPAGVFATGGPPRLTLYTCGGQWDAKKKQYPLHVVVNAYKV